jgi:hypothetical protein
LAEEERGPVALLRDLEKHLAWPKSGRLREARSWKIVFYLLSPRF